MLTPGFERPSLHPTDPLNRGVIQQSLQIAAEKIRFIFRPQKFNARSTMPFGLLLGPATLAPVPTPPGGPVASPMAAATSLRAVADKYRRSPDHYLALADASAVLRGARTWWRRAFVARRPRLLARRARKRPGSRLPPRRHPLRTIEGVEPDTKPTTGKEGRRLLPVRAFRQLRLPGARALPSAVYSMILSSHPAASAMLAGIASSTPSQALPGGRAHLLVQQTPARRAVGRVVRPGRRGGARSRTGARRPL